MNSESDHSHNINMRKLESYVRSFDAYITGALPKQDRVSYIQSTEWNSSSVSKRSDRHIYTSEIAPI